MNGNNGAIHTARIFRIIKGIKLSRGLNVERLQKERSVYDKVLVGVQIKLNRILFIVGKYYMNKQVRVQANIKLNKLQQNYSSGQLKVCEQNGTVQNIKNQNVSFQYLICEIFKYMQRARTNKCANSILKYYTIWMFLNEV
ncbi:hypothetical protein TTHERM_00125690 (macronuclear) [Tetrahymena thermophila SB210]|uniref:Uncharacterized protein n=1 Tax=Tetrahymena thermophila (strain SB210) TaxID=312017 RepID=I7LUT4_TETTS|nr:hypothetical protein TTHERM_00125690 [Tetrahymena thermophila SB210]EAR96003.1 hypothetical protein TTHERM_00125690 [Tetrahymena thermophila SB210]|eukprot:XP_001016248.1 hypothetical protein TTHERM_00125690 [Tetrahymena thermophila SB210]